MKYVVINVIEREILKVGVADTPKKTTGILKNDFMNEWDNNGYTKEDFENKVGCGYEWELNATDAWMNTSNANYDWRIIEVD
jgi:hypothetical protein